MNPATAIRRLAHELAAAKRAAVYGRVGVHTVPSGTVASWATDLLNVITGNLDRPGGAMWGQGAHARRSSPSGGGRGYRIGRWTSRVSGYAEVNGELPVAALAEEIETDGPDRIRAMITIGGNPILSTPHSDRLDAAFATLDFMVSVDPYVNETTRHADVILPVPSALQRSHYDAAFYNQALRRVANYSPALFSTEQPSESDIIATLALIIRGDADADPSIIGAELLDEVLAHAIGDPNGNVGGRDLDELRAAVTGDNGPDRLVDALVRTGPFGDGFGDDPDGLTLQRLIDHPHGIDFGPLEPQLPGILRTPSGKIELAPIEIVSALPALLASATIPTSNGLRLIGRRDLRSNNSWMHNVHVLVKGKERCTLLINPADAAERELSTGDTAVVESPVGRVEAPVEVTDEMMAGVVCLPHGWGHDAPGTRLSIAGQRPGVNSNVLTDGAVLDPISGNATLNGIPVTVERV